MTLSLLPTSIPATDDAGRDWLRTSAALALALGLVVATSAQAGDCGTVAPVAEAPAWVDDRAPTTAEFTPIREPISGGATLMARYPDPTDAAAPADVGLAGRPTGPEVQPCRHLPRAQMIECLRTTGTAGTRLTDSAPAR